VPQTPIGNIATKQGLVYLNDRVAPGDERFFSVPAGRLFVLTDVVVQNRAPGDLPVAAGQFTRFSITSPAGTDVFFDVVGNDTLGQHFTTGLPVTGAFRFFVIGNSTAPFVEFHITGVLRDL
jgi:hypothetical protein